MTWPVVQVVTAAFGAEAIPLRFVGGCVRDTLLNQPVADLDATTPAPPQTVLDLATEHGIKAIPTGLDHGTVTLVVEGTPLEVTTLRKDMDTDGRHAVVAFTQDWATDAKRRDFTINALYLDANGALYDPTGGLDDLDPPHVRFIDQADDRIQEDYLRILRFFRFTARFNTPNMDQEALLACQRHAHSLKKLSAERVTAEFLKIMQAKDPVPTIEVMSNLGILTPLFPSGLDLTALKHVVAMEHDLGAPQDADRRLIVAALSGSELREDNLRHLRLSKAQLKRATLMVDHIQTPLTTEAIERVAYVQGPQAAHDLLITAPHMPPTMRHGLHDHITHWIRPTFPLSGADLAEHGIPTGPKMGLFLKQAEALWIEKRFRLTKAALLESVLNSS